jgi:DNA polymerase III alpha subunit
MLQGVASIDGLIEKAKLYQLPSLALTDTNGMYGLISFFKKAREENIKPLLGTYIDEPNERNIYAIFIAKNQQGFSELCKIITNRKLKNDFSLFSLLQNHLPNLFNLTPSIQLLKSISFSSQMRENIFAELIASKKRNYKMRELFQYAKENKINYVASQPIYFLNKEDYPLHKVVTAIKNRTTIDNLSQRDEFPKEYDLVNEEFYFKNPKELDKIWKNLPLALSNQLFITENSNVDLKIGELKFPNYETPDKTDSFTIVWNLAFEGLQRRYSQKNVQTLTDTIKNLLIYELEVIHELNYVDYFLIVWDIVQEAKRRGMLLIGRGSAANSLLSYCLGITEVDPIKYNLYFERFLNRSRKTPPDVDLDFSWKERDEIIRYVFEKYGYDRVAMISTHVTFRARSAFRETAKVFGFSDNEISKISKYIPWTDARNLPNITRLYPEAKKLKLDEEPFATIVSIASKLANFPRHLSIHPGGIIIAPDKITNYTALEFTRNKGIGLIVTQPDMYGIEDLGLVKIDLLSQRSLGVLRDTLKLIQTKNHNKQKLLH